MISVYNYIKIDDRTSILREQIESWRIVTLQYWNYTATRILLQY